MQERVFTLHFDCFERKKEWRCFAGYLPRAVSEELRPRFFDLVREASKQMQSAQILQVNFAHGEVVELETYLDMPGGVICLIL